MFKLSVIGEHEPPRDSHEHKMWKRVDPIALLRSTFANQQRSRHWRIAHGAKKAFQAAAVNSAKCVGDKIDGPAFLAIATCLNRCDLDAPLKSLIDSTQELALASGNDKDIASISVIPFKPQRGNSNKANIKPGYVAWFFDVETEFAQFITHVEHLLFLWKNSQNPYEENLKRRDESTNQNSAQIRLIS